MGVGVGVGVGGGYGCMHAYLSSLICTPMFNPILCSFCCTVSKHTDLNTPNSTFLKTAELSISGSSVTIRCEFADEYPDASCVLVYRKYDNPTLLLNESIVPFTIFIDDINLENYTFAVFGKNSRNIEKEPVIVLKNEQHATYPPSETCKYNTLLPPNNEKQAFIGR